MPVDVELLLVEDNPNDAELTLRALKRNHLANHMVWVKDGVEALDFLFARGTYANRAQCERPKVILLDLRMPKLDGIEVLTAIKQDERTCDIPVVVLTSSNEDKDIETCYRLGVNSFVSKPVVFEDFIKTVTQLGFYWLLVNKQPAP
ncbi:MAG TPA: response regulator [Stenomitos sp.]